MLNTLTREWSYGSSRCTKKYACSVLNVGLHYDIWGSFLINHVSEANKQWEHFLAVHCQSTELIPSRGLCLRLSLALGFAHEVSFCIWPAPLGLGPSTIVTHLSPPPFGSPQRLLHFSLFRFPFCRWPRDICYSWNVLVKCCLNRSVVAPRHCSLQIPPPPRWRQLNTGYWTLNVLQFRFDSSCWPMRLPTSKTNCCILMWGCR